MYRGQFFTLPFRFPIIMRRLDSGMQSVYSRAPTTSAKPRPWAKLMGSLYSTARQCGHTVSHFFQNVYHKVRYSDPPRLLFDLLSKFRIFIFPFNLYNFIVEQELSFPPPPESLNDYRCQLLGRERLEDLARIPRKGNMLVELGKRFDAGEIPFGIMKGDEVVGYCWFNREECTSKLYNFVFEGNSDIYLFDVYVSPHYRGLGLAPYLVTQFYPWLQTEGIEKVYATINLFNNPSNQLTVNYRQETLVKMLYVSLFNIYEHTFLLKRYKV